MTKRVAINGFGRIGRCVHGIMIPAVNSDTESAAITDLTGPKTLARRPKHYSVHGIFPNETKEISRFTKRIPVDPSWRDPRVEMVLERTGLFRTHAAAISMIPTTMGAARAVGLVLPELNGELKNFIVDKGLPDNLAKDCVGRPRNRFSGKGVPAS